MKRSGYVAGWFWGTLLMLVLFLTGCTGLNLQGPAKTNQEFLPPISGFVEDLQDIEIPSDMEWIHEESTAIKTESFHGGIWKYGGKLEMVSLKKFMVDSMKNNKWKLVGEVSSEQILMAFVKPGKNCMIVISSGYSYFDDTILTLYVTIDKTAAVGLNPFGEAIMP